MAYRHNAIRAGQAHLEQVMELIEDGDLSPEDLAVLLAQVDLIYTQLARLQVSSPLPDWRILAHLCRPEGIRAMVEAGAHPRMIQAIRRRRARTFDLLLSRLQVECCRRVGRAMRSACRSGEWLLCPFHGCRCLQLRYNILQLKLARRFYLMGFTVDVRPTVERLRLLMEST